MPRRTTAKISNKEIPSGFRRTPLFEAARTHPSFRNENRCPPLEDFDRLEFFGDAVLNYIVCHELYRRFPQADEGELSRLRSTLVSRRILARIARALRLGRSIRVGNSLRRQPDAVRSKVLADTFEAMLGALYFDQGLARAERFIRRHFTGYFDAKRLLRLDPNPKSLLQELSQKHWKKLPEYTHQTGPKGVKTQVAVLPSLRASAWGKSRREAEEGAARLLVRKIRQRLSRALRKSSSGRK